MGWIIFGILLGIIAVIVHAFLVSLHNSNKQHTIAQNQAQKRKMSKSLSIILFILPILIFGLLASSTRVGTGEVAVMTRFGKVTGQELGEGFHFKNPFDAAHIYDVKVLKIETNAESASKDLQDVYATLVINYLLEPGQVSDIHQTVGEAYKEKIIDNGIQEVVKASTAKYNATELITNRPSVKKDAYEALRDRLEPYGIVVRDLAITNLSFSDKFTEAIEAKQVAQQQAEQAKFNADKAKQDAQAEINRAKGSSEAQRLQQETLTKLLVQKQFIEKWNGELPKVTGGGNILNIDKLFKANQ